MSSPPPLTLKTELYDFQKHALERMLQSELEGVHFDKIEKRYNLIGTEKHQLWYDYMDVLRPPEECDRVQFSCKGGFLTLKMGMGKSLTILSLCVSNPIRPMPSGRRPRATLILCPSHVVAHWASEITKHVPQATCVTLTTKDHLEKTKFSQIMSDELGPDFVIVSFSVLCNPAYKKRMEYYTCAPVNKPEAFLSDFLRQSPEEQAAQPFVPHVFDWGRVVIDEFHEVANANYPNVMTYLSSLKGASKWLVSGTPMVNPTMYRFFVPNLFFGSGGKSLKIPMYDATLELIRRTNISASSTSYGEVGVPGVKEDVRYVTLTSAERAIYDAMQNEGRDQQLRVCSYPRLAHIVQSSDQIVYTMNDMEKVARDHLTQRIDYTERKLVTFRLKLEALGAPPSGGDEPTERNRETQYARELRDVISADETILKNLQATLAYVTSFGSSEQTDCAICLERLSQPCMLKTCGHRMCFDCMHKSLRLSSSSCPICRQPCSMQSVIKLIDPSEEQNERRQKYGSKLYELLQFLNSTGDTKTLVFSQWDELLRDVGTCVTEFTQRKVVYCRGNVSQKRSAINKFTTSDSHNLLLLSTLNSGSGSDLSVAKRVILLDTVDGSTSFANGVERQAIARCHRIGQKDVVNVIRFIVKDTIEESIYRDHMS